MAPRKIMTRVPHIITLYWIIKIAATTLGETGADFVSMTLNIGYELTIFIFLFLFLIFFSVKMMMKRYEPIAYWLTFTTSAIAGTAISDYLDRTLEMGYAVGSLLLIITLCFTLGIWYLKEGNLSVEHISTPRQEAFYWVAFLIANTLGTAMGDFLADDLGFGFLPGSLCIGGILLSLAIYFLLTKKSAVFLFWMAFILTRPFGATFGDLLTKPLIQGGLGFGTIGACMVFSVALTIALWFELKREKDIQTFGSTL